MVDRTGTWTSCFDGVEPYETPSNRGQLVPNTPQDPHTALARPCTTPEARAPKTTGSELTKFSLVYAPVVL